MFHQPWDYSQETAFTFRQVLYILSITCGSVVVTIGPVCPTTETPKFMVYGKTQTHVNIYLGIIQSWGCLEGGK